MLHHQVWPPRKGLQKEKRGETERKDRIQGVVKTRRKIKRGEKLDKDSAPQWTSLEFAVTRLKLIYHKGRRCDETPLIYCKGPWLPLTLFTIWHQVVASTTSLCDLWGKDSSRLVAEKKTVLGHGKEITRFSFGPQRKQQQQLLDRHGQEPLKHSPGTPRACHSEERS